MSRLQTASSLVSRANDIISSRFTWRGFTWACDRGAEYESTGHAIILSRYQVHLGLALCVLLKDLRGIIWVFWMSVVLLLLRAPAAQDSQTHDQSVLPTCILFQQQVSIFPEYRPITLHRTLYKYRLHTCYWNRLYVPPSASQDCSFCFDCGTRRSILLASQKCIHKSFAHKHHKSPPIP